MIVSNFDHIWNFARADCDGSIMDRRCSEKFTRLRRVEGTVRAIEDGNLALEYA